MDKVHTIDAIHDGCPLAGIADCQGHPHTYVRQFDDESDDWSDHFILRRVDADSLAIALEIHEIFLKWKKALSDGKVTKESLIADPSYASDHQRYD